MRMTILYENDKNESQPLDLNKYLRLKIMFYTFS
jgi:hypothetical protein